MLRENEFKQRFQVTLGRCDWHTGEMKLFPPIAECRRYSRNDVLLNFSEESLYWLWFVARAERGQSKQDETQHHLELGARMSS
jgi:hypothetical protein